MKHPLIVWLILALLITALLAAGWTNRLCNIIDSLKASGDSRQQLAASTGSLVPVTSRASSLRLVSLVSTSDSLLQAGTTGDQPAIPTSSPEHIPPQVVPFLDETVPHDEFELTDRHGEPECLKCHSDGRYTGTESTCQACHNIPPATEELLNQSFLNMYALLGETEFQEEYSYYPDHFGEQCEDCHDSGSWEPVTFDHKGIVECISCHAEDISTVRILPDPIYLPWKDYLSFVEVISDPDHFPGDCQFCHTSTTDWKDVWYTHDYIFECESCHLEQLPESHYPGPCASCHSNYDYWPDAIVNHEHLEDCLVCHSTHVSDDHILGSQPGMCSTCHTTNSWNIQRYSHVIQLSCTTCHSKPSGHYSGDCSQCHNTRTWVPDDFFHSNAGDCQRCHNSPENHYPGSCSTCHTTRGWRSISYDHAEVRECATCHNEPVGHYSGFCSACHSTTNWSDYSFDHLGHLYCIDCHASDEPQNHYSDDCYACHDVNSWGNATRYHSSTSDCGACHTAPEAHYIGQCSSCHNTVTWFAIDFDHSRYTICTECHDAPSGHWPGACSDCHNTLDWADYTFNHTGYNICNACHDRPAGHFRGQCSKCHNTESWWDLNPSHFYSGCLTNYHQYSHASDKTRADLNTYSIADTIAHCPTSGGSQPHTHPAANPDISAGEHSNPHTPSGGYRDRHPGSDPCHRHHPTPAGAGEHPDRNPQRDAYLAAGGAENHPNPDPAAGDSPPTWTDPLAAAGEHHQPARTRPGSTGRLGVFPGGELYAGHHACVRPDDALHLRNLKYELEGR